MNTLRQVAQQALEALEQSETFVPYEGFGMARREAERKHQAAITALRAALAEPCSCGDRPAAQCPGEWEPGCDLGNNPKYAKRVEMTPKELAASIKRGEKWKVAKTVQEPVAKVELMTTGGNAGLATRIVEIDNHLRERLRPGQLLYTSPPQRKPLTEEEIRQIAIDTPNTPKAFARAIERAHEICE